MKPKGRIVTDNVDEVCRTLLEYCSQSKRALTSGSITKHQARELASTIEQIRQLLHELAVTKKALPGDDKRQKVFALHAQYVELEGLAKEKRNDLCSGEDFGTA